MLSKKQIKIYEFLLRIGIFGTFLGHGILALGIKQNWIPLITAFGFSEGAAIVIMPMIGILDILVAFFALIRPIRIILIWASLWTFATALSRPISGEPVWEFIERAANWTIPLVLLLLHGFPKRLKDLWTIKYSSSEMTNQNSF